jgi:hypothetical protein
VLVGLCRPALLLVSSGPGVAGTRAHCKSCACACSHAVCVWVFILIVAAGCFDSCGQHLGTRLCVSLMVLFSSYGRALSMRCHAGHCSATRECFTGLLRHSPAGSALLGTSYCWQQTQLGWVAVWRSLAGQPAAANDVCVFEKLCHPLRAAHSFDMLCGVVCAASALCCCGRAGLGVARLKAPAGACTCQSIQHHTHSCS